MTQQGAPAGKVVPALVQSSGNALALLLAGAASSRPLAPLGPKLTPRELVDCVERLDPAVLLTDPRFERLANEVATEVGCSVAVVDDMPTSTLPLPAADPGDIALVLHTSGTTGTPKSVRYTHRHLLERTRVNAGLIGLAPGCGIHDRRALSPHRRSRQPPRGAGIRCHRGDDPRVQRHGVAGPAPSRCHARAARPHHDRNSVARAGTGFAYANDARIRRIAHPPADTAGRHKRCCRRSTSSTSSGRRKAVRSPISALPTTG